MADTFRYVSRFVNCRELATASVSLTGDRARGDDSKNYAMYNECETRHIFRTDDVGECKAPEKIT